jgi:hypothetical protein
MYSIKRWLCVSVACGALVACGGGGGGGGGDDGAGLPTQATGRFESSTYATTTDDAVMAVSGSLASDALIPVAAASSGSGTAAAPQASLLAMTRDAARRAVERGVLVRPQATERYSDIESCDSGQIDFVLDYASADTVTPGDFLQMSFQSCVIAGETFTGSARFTVRSYSANSASESVSFDIAFQQFGSVSLRLHGGAQIIVSATSTSETVRLSFLGLTATTPDGSRSWYHTTESVWSGSNETLRLSGFVQAGGQFYELTQLTPFSVDSAGRPVSGRLRLTDAQGARVEVEATATRFVYTYYAPGATTPTHGPVDGLTYAQLGW